MGLMAAVDEYARRMIAQYGHADALRRAQDAQRRSNDAFASQNWGRIIARIQQLSRASSS